MKVALLVNHFFPFEGGCETVVRRIAEHLAEKHDVHVFTRHCAKRTSKKLGAVTIEGYDPGSPNSFLSKIKIFDPQFTLLYSDVFDFFHPAVDHVKNLTLAFCGANRLYSKAFSMTFLRQRLPFIRSFVCHTKCERDFKLAERMKILDRTFVIPNGVDLEEFDSNNLSRQDIAPEGLNDLWVLNVSNFFPGKGQMHLIDVIKKMSNKNVTYVQVCSSVDFAIGKQLEEQWKAKANALPKMEIDVVLMKDKPRKNVIAMFKNSNVFAFTSEKESAGLVLLESMAAGVPWVATNVGIAPEVKGGFSLVAGKDAHYNSIFDQQMIETFSQKINECLAHPEIGNEGRIDVEENYQWKDILPQYERLLP